MIPKSRRKHTSAAVSCPVFRGFDLAILSILTELSGVILNGIAKMDIAGMVII